MIFSRMSKQNDSIKNINGNAVTLLFMSLYILRHKDISFFF